MKVLFQKRRNKYPKLETINIADLSHLDLPSEKNAIDQQDMLPASFDLLLFEDDDDVLLQYIEDNPSESALVPTTLNVSIATTKNTMTTSMPILPKMFFPTLMSP